MNKYLKSYLIKKVGLENTFPTGLNTPEVINSLLKRLYPVSTEKGLIRLGPNGDGGYLVPDALEGIHACFSPGVSSVSGFEKDCADLGMKVFLADKSVAQPAETHELFHFTKKHVGAMSNADFMTLDDWVKSALPEESSELLLQIDIEGYEYEVFLSTSEALLKRFRVIVAEFHQLKQLWNKPFFNLASRAFEKILQSHSCVHIHPNNCRRPLRKSGLVIPPIMEFTFLRNDYVHSSTYQQEFPHPLDCNNTGNPTEVLPSCWYSEKKSTGID